VPDNTLIGHRALNWPIARRRYIAGLPFSVRSVAGMTLTAEEIAQINLAENMTIGSSVSATVSTSETFPGGPYEDILWYVAMVYTEKQGTCDLYGADGFDGAQNWDAITSIYPSVVTHSYLAATYN
jgi:hypothetical protein